MDNGAFIEVDGWTVEIFRGFQPHYSSTSSSNLAITFFTNLIFVSMFSQIRFQAISIQPSGVRKGTDLSFCILASVKVPKLSTWFVILCPFF